MKRTGQIIGSFALLGSASASGCADSPLGLPGNLVLILAPFVAFLLLFYWGLQKKSRKKPVIRLGYMLIGLQVLLSALFPYMVDGLSCTGVAWAIPASIMVLSLVAFMLYRRSREQMHDEVIRTARMRGHLMAPPEPGVGKAKLVESVTDYSRYMPPGGPPEPEPEPPVVETEPVTVSRAEVVEETDLSKPEETEKPPLARKVETEAQKPEHKEMEKLIKSVLRKSKR